MKRKVLNKNKKHQHQKTTQEDYSLITKHKSSHKNKAKLTIPNQCKFKKSVFSQHKSNHNQITPQLTHHSKNQHTSKRTNRHNQIHISLLPQNQSGIRNHQDMNNHIVNHGISLPLNNCESIRQYCIVDQSFVPLINSNDKRFISGLMSQSISTADNWKNKTTGDVHIPRKRIDKSIMTKVVEYKSQEINTTIQLSDGYSQYSQRDQNVQKEKQQTLDEILLKLQFMYLPNDKSFEKLSRVQKQHYCQLLNCLITKLQLSPRQSITPLQTQAQRQKIIQRMQCDQIQLDLKHRNDNIGIDYTSIGILHFISNLFCFIQLNYSQQLIDSLNKIHGLGYKDKFMRLARNLPTNGITPKVLNPTILTDYIKQTMNIHQIIEDGPPSQQEGYKYIFHTAIFDAINEQAITYRAYYSSDGQPFPWNTKIIKSFTFFTIDQQSIEVVLAQLRQKMQQLASFLCGIIYDTPLQLSLKPNDKRNPLIMKRRLREDKLIMDWLQKIEQIPQIENEATMVYLYLSNLITQILIEQVSKQINQI